jgi:hypothetical protein
MPISNLEQLAVLAEMEIPALHLDFKMLPPGKMFHQLAKDSVCSKISEAICGMQKLAILSLLHLPDSLHTMFAWRFPLVKTFVITCRMRRQRTGPTRVYPSDIDLPAAESINVQGHSVLSAVHFLRGSPLLRILRVHRGTFPRPVSYHEPPMAVTKAITGLKQSLVEGTHSLTHLTTIELKSCVPPWLLETFSYMTKLTALSVEISRDIRTDVSTWLKSMPQLHLLDVRSSQWQVEELRQADRIE